MRQEKITINLKKIKSSESSELHCFLTEIPVIFAVFQPIFAPFFLVAKDYG